MAQATMATMATMGSMVNTTGNITQSITGLVTMMLAMPPTTQQLPRRQHLFPRGQLPTTPPTTLPHHTTLPNITNPAQFLTVQHPALSHPDVLPPREPPSAASALCPSTNARCPGGDQHRGVPQGTTATPSWCRATRVLSELPASHPRSRSGSRSPTFPRPCP